MTMTIRTLALAALAVVTAGAPASADTLLIVGVAVDTAGARMPGALVRLYATSNVLKTPLAEDRTSERGIFSLYRTNIAGDIGDLFVVYEGATHAVATPLKVTVAAVTSGLLQSRTADLIILDVPQTASLTNEEAAERLAAIAQTQAVLVKAGVAEADKAEDAVAVRSAQVALAVRHDQLTLSKGTLDRAMGVPGGFDPGMLQQFSKTALQATIKDP